MAKKQKQKSKKKAIQPEVKEAAETAAPKKPFNPKKFLDEVVAEGKKVTWTGQNEVLISSILVLVMVVLMSGFFFIVDSFFRWLIPLILQTFS